MPIQVAIPAAGRIRDTTEAETLVCPLFRNIKGKSFIGLILETLKNSKLDIGRISIGIQSLDVDQLEYLVQPFSKDFDFNIVSCDSSNSAAETLRMLLRTLAPGEKTLVNLGDTLVDLDWHEVDKYPCGLGVTSPAMPIDRLATIAVPVGDRSENRGLVGVYWFTSSEDSSDQLSFSTVEDFVLKRPGTPKALEVISWIDADYSDRFTREASSTFESRNFNSVTRDSTSNLLRKSSAKIEKLKSEFDFVTGLEPEAASLFPAVRSFEVRDGLAVLAMDYWPYSNLSDMYCFSYLSDSFWTSLMREVRKALRTLHASSTKVDAELFDWAFFEKTNERLLQLEGEVDWAGWATKPLDINGVRCRAIANLISEAAALLAGRPKVSARVHGDFCFSNILIDPNTMMLKLVDPRGAFKGSTDVGPIDYDMAKFAHSALGDYDLILKGQYHLEESSLDKVHFEIHYPPHREAMVDAFQTALVGSQQELESLRLLSALILISIPPLHLEDERRARMFLIKGRYDAEIALKRLRELD